MTIFESAVKTIYASEQDIFAVLSDLRNAEKLKDRIPEDKVKDIQIWQDSISFVVEPVGELSLRIIDQEPFKTIKFVGENSPVGFFVWIELEGIGEDETKMKITLKADLNPIVKMMAEKPLQQFVDMLANALATLEYKSMC